MRTAACRLAASVVALSALSGCASSVYEGKYAWDEGWREAKVVQVGAAPELGGRHSSDCRYRAPQSTGTAERYAVVSYRNVGRERRAVVPVSASEAFARGDTVYANVRECSMSTLVRRAHKG